MSLLRCCLDSLRGVRRASDRCRWPSRDMRRPAPQWTLASARAEDAQGPRCPTSGSVPALQRAPGSPSLAAARGSPPRGSGREGGVSGAGGRAGGSCIKSAGGAAAPASFSVCGWDRECGEKAPARDRALRSGYPMLGLSAAAARAICWSSRSAKRSRHTAAWAGSQRCLSL